MGVPDIDTALGWRGRTVLDRNGEKLGTLTELYLDSEDSRPAWAGIKRGLLRGGETIVPLAGVEEADDDLRLPFEHEHVDAAPAIDPEVQLTPDQEEALHAHFGRDWARASGEETDDAMTRSEEEVSFTTRPVKRAERVRLKKVVVTDEVTQTVRRRCAAVALPPDPSGRERRWSG